MIPKLTLETQNEKTTTTPRISPLQGDVIGYSKSGLVFDNTRTKEFREKKAVNSPVCLGSAQILNSVEEANHGA